MNLSSTTVFARLRDFLRQGITPEKLAFCLALGLSLSCCPILGITTTLCTLAALSFRLNLPAIQMANYAATPLQLLLLLPFVRMGERIFRSQRLPLSAREIAARFHVSFLGTVKALWTWEWHAVVAWLIVAIPATGILTLLFRTILCRMEGTPPTNTSPAEA